MSRTEILGAGGANTDPNTLRNRRVRPDATGLKVR